jgi:hypothetical protein
MFETFLIKTIRGFLSYFSNPMSEFCLTYRCELIDEDSELGAKRRLEFYALLSKHTPYYKALHMTTHPRARDLRNTPRCCDDSASLV